MTYTPKDWHDRPDTTTPIDAAALEDLEARLAGYVDAQVAAIPPPPPDAAPPLVASLPASPADGDEIYYNVGAGSIWQLRYQTGVGWVFLGGSPMAVIDAGPYQQDTANQWKPAGTTQIVVPATGLYELTFANLLGATVANTSYRVGAGAGVNGTIGRVWTMIVGTDKIASTDRIPHSYGPAILQFAAGTILRPLMFSTAGTQVITRDIDLTLRPVFLS